MLFFFGILSFCNNSCIVSECYRWKDFKKKVSSYFTYTFFVAEALTISTNYVGYADFGNKVVKLDSNCNVIEKGNFFVFCTKNCVTY